MADMAMIYKNMTKDVGDKGILYIFLWFEMIGTTIKNKWTKKRCTTIKNKKNAGLKKESILHQGDNLQIIYSKIICKVGQKIAKFQGKYINR